MHECVTPCHAKHQLLWRAAAVLPEEGVPPWAFWGEKIECSGYSFSAWSSSLPFLSWVLYGKPSIKWDENKPREECICHASGQIPWFRKLRNSNVESYSFSVRGNCRVAACTQWSGIGAGLSVARACMRGPCLGASPLSSWRFFQHRSSEGMLRGGDSSCSKLEIIFKAAIAWACSYKVRHFVHTWKQNLSGWNPLGLCKCL